MNNANMTEKARAAVNRLVAGSSLNAVARLIGIPQPTLHRFVSKPDTSLSLKNFEKIAPYIEPARRAVAEPVSGAADDQRGVRVSN